MRTILQAKIITPAALSKMRYPVTKHMTEAAGLLKGKKRVNALRYQLQMRREWERRYKKLLRAHRL